MLLGSSFYGPDVWIYVGAQYKGIGITAPARPYAANVPRCLGTALHGHRLTHPRYLALRGMDGVC